MSLSGGADQLTVASYFGNAGKGANALEKIRFADGTGWKYATVLSKVTNQAGVSAAQALVPEIRAGNPSALFDTPQAAATQVNKAAVAQPGIAESISAARQRFEQGLQAQRLNVDAQGTLGRNEFMQRRTLPLLWNLQDALLGLQLAKNPDGRLTAGVSIDSRATRDLGLGVAMLGGAAGNAGPLGQVARPQQVQQFDLAQIH